MGLFRYEAVDKVGKVVRGVMDARDEQQVAAKLNGMGYSARAVYGASGQPPAGTSQTQARTVASPSNVTRAGGAQSVTVASGVPVSIKSKVPSSSLAVFFRQLATLVKSGRPLYQSSTDIMVRDRRLMGVVPRIQERVQGGGSLSSVMAEFPGLFPVHTTASVWAGELAGKLDIALEEVAADLELEASEVRFGRIGWGLGKLGLILLVFSLPASNVTALLLPALQQTMKHAEWGSSDVLRFIFQNYMATMFWKSVLLSLAIIAFWIVFGRVKRLPKVKRLLDGILLNMPVWGSLHRYRALARFLHVLDGLYAAGIVPGTAWDAAGLAPRNSAVAEKLKLARGKASPGAGIAELFAVSGVFDQEDVVMAGVGEKSGQLPDVLANMSRIYDDKAAAQKRAGRMWSSSLLVSFLILLGGIVTIVLTKTYFDLAFKIADMVGQ